jgi:hypothetical protein
MPEVRPRYRPKFSPQELARARKVSRKRRAAHAVVQRAKLALLLAKEPAMTNPEAGRRLGLHQNSIRYWRKRWAREGFSLEDRPRSGRPRVFSPPSGRLDQGRCLRTPRET